MKRRCFKKHLLYFIIILIIFLSGCLGKLETYEKDICLSVTHYSKTSIFDCTKQSSCYNKLNSNSKIEIPNDLPKEIYNKIEIYKNSIASSIFYFNESKDELEKINKFCEDPDSQEIKNIIDNVNNVMFYISNVFTYLDKSSQNSIELIKDYSIYLKEEDINYIAEEDLYSYYIVLNNNLNELKNEKIINKDNYIAEVKENCKILNELASSFGFNKSYVSKINYIDLYAYYYDFTKTIQENKIPKYSIASSFLIKEVSNLESFNKLNISLASSDAYNLYLYFDKILGINNSTHTNFVELINNINKEIEVVNNKIIDLETYCFENKSYLDSKSKGELILNNHKYKYNNLSKGKYLSFLKKIKEKIDVNIIDEQKINAEQNLKLNECNKLMQLEIVEDNLFLELLKEQYYNSENYVDKINICKDVRKNLLLKNNCLNTLSNFLEKDIDGFQDLEYLLLEDIDNNKCHPILININNRLEDYQKIVDIKENIELIEQEISNYYLFDIKKDPSKIEEYNKNLEQIKELNNIELILNFEENYKLLNTILEDLYKINKDNLIEYIKNNYKIVYKDNNYYLNINNIYPKAVENITINSIYLTNVKSLDNRLKINNSNIELTILNKNNNYYMIDYENKKEVVKNILKLTTNKSIVELKIKNTVENIKDSQYVGQVEIPISKNYNYDNNTIYYLTKKENNFIYYEKYIEEELIDKKIKEISDDKYIIEKNILLKNISEIDIDQILYYGNINPEDEIIIKDYKQKKIDTIQENNNLLFNIKLDGYKDKAYSVFVLKNKESVYLEIDDITNTIIQLKNSRFEDIVKKIDNLLKEYELDNEEIFYKEDLDFETIKRLFLIKEKINNIENKEEELDNYENQFIILYNNIKDNINLQKEYSSKELNKLYDERYKDIESKLEILKDIDLKIKENIDSNNVKELISKKENIKEFKEKIEDYNITNSNINKKLEEDVNSINKEDLLIIENTIDLEIKNKAEDLYNKIDLYKELDYNSINNLLNISSKQYEKIDIKDLHFIDIYPEITTYDIERIYKKIKFLETVKLKDQLNSFYNNYNKEDYEKAINSVDKTTIDRLEEIDNEKELLSNFINKYKTKSKELIDLEEDLEEKETYKQLFLEDQYLYILYLANSKSNDSNLEIDNFSQNLILLVLLFIFFILFLYFKNGKKEIDYKSKKKKIIRKY